MNKALQELLTICDIESTESTTGWIARREAMKAWIDKYVKEAECSLSVVNPELFTSEYQDFIKESLVQKMSEDLTTYTEYKYNNRQITAKMKVLKVNGL